MKKILIIVVVLLIIGAGAWYFTSSKRKAYVPSSKVEVNDKGFSISQGNQAVSGQNINDTTNLNLGIAVYPSSQIISGENAAQDLNYGGVKARAATYQTSDPKSKVEQYYQTQIGSDAVKVDGVNGSMTYTVIKSKTNIGPLVMTYSENNTTYFTIIKPVK